MAKYDISHDEWWPVHELDADEDGVEVPDHLVMRWEACMSEYRRVQRALQDLHGCRE